MTTLAIQGYVTAAVAVSPERVRFRGYPGDTLSMNVRISPAAGVKLALSTPVLRNGKDIRVTLTPITTVSPTAYRLTVDCIKSVPGNISDTITILTGVPVKPRITIPVTGILLKRKNPSE